MKNFRGKLAVVTGGGTGMGRELTKQLAAEGCHVAICDVSTENMAETKRLAAAGAPAGVRITTHVCDVADENQVIAFRDAVAVEHATKHVNLLFNNAGIGGGGSFLEDDRTEWERTFDAISRQPPVTALRCDARLSESTLRSVGLRRYRCDRRR